MSALPGVKGTIEDYGLNVSPEPQNLNDSILIVGTASDGPMNEPIPIIGDKNLTESIFGSFGDGTLVRGVFESIDSTIEGTPDIRAMRIGNGKKSSLEINERLSSSAAADQKTTSHNSLKLEALYPGSKYNGVSIHLDEEKKINLYNPKTGVYSTFTYDDRNPNNTAVDARNVSELVDAINSDSNASSVIIASTSGIQAQYELLVNANSSGVSVASNKTILDLKTILASYTSTGNPDTDVQATGYIWEATTAATAGNLLDEIEEVFSISISNPVELETKGKTSVNVELTPFDGKGDSRFDTIQALEDYNSDNFYFHSPIGSPTSGEIISEYMNYLDKEVLPDVTTGATGLMAFNAELSVPGWFMAPDDSFETTVIASGDAIDGQGPAQTVIDSDGNSGTSADAYSGCMALAAARASSGVYKASQYIFANKVSADTAIVEDYARITASGISDYFTNPGKVIIEMSDTGGTSDSEWTQLLYHAASGVYVSGFAVADGTGTATICIGQNATGYLGTSSLVTAGLITTSGSVNSDKYLRMSCNTVKGFLSEAESLPALQAADSDWLTYFFRGKELIFSDTVPFNTVVNYGIKVNYEPGSDVQVTDAANGEIKFLSSTQPGPGGDELSTDVSSIIGLKYKYLPQFPSITTAALSLDGGTDGTSMSNENLYDTLADAYDNLENYDVQILVPMDANLDSTKTSYNSITGLEETVNAQFQVQLQDFLKSRSEDVGNTMGILGVESPDSTKLADIKTWVKRLTIQDLSDPLRGANIMPLLDSYRISVCAFEPVFNNLGGLPYAANGQAAYAGMISSLEPHYSPTNKSLKNAQRMRFNLSNSQLEALAEMRFVSMRKKSDRNPVITEAVTAAAGGSDFVKLTTARITFAAMAVVRKVCDPFIGQPNSQGKRNAMESSIVRGLQSLVDIGALRKFDFNISSSPKQQVQGIVEIELILVPVFELKTVRTKVRLRIEIPSAT